jgi:crotonobetainyl-CoA:carnitine CoA-transferase CaiB-like acyl-CoA transferase
MNIFSNLSVLDLSTVLAGPSVASFFAELGARVIKVENPNTKGDVTRSWRHKLESSNAIYSAYYASANFNKEIVFLDLTNPSHRKKIRDFVYTSDIVLTNFKNGDAEKFELTNADIQRINPMCIHGKITGFSSDHSRVAYDVVLQAETGFMSMNGTETSTKIPVAIADIMAAHQLKQGILCALIKRSTDNKGNVVECSLEQSAISALVNQASVYLMTGKESRQQGSLHPSIAPYGEVMTCANATEIVLAIGTDKQFQEFCHCIQLPKLIDDYRFSTNQLRVQNRIELKTLINEQMQSRTATEWISDFNKRNIPAGVIKSLSQVFESPTAKDMIKIQNKDGEELRSVSQLAFKIE